jgi:putative restriction endonuclease
MTPTRDEAIRARVFADLDRMLRDTDGTLTRTDLLGYSIDGEALPLIDYSRGIRNPRALDATLAVVSSPSGPYADKELFPGVWLYSFRAGSAAGDNTKLRAAKELEADIILFHKPEPNVYQPIYPVRVIEVDEDPGHVVLALPEVAEIRTESASVVEREWAAALTYRRVHQPAFRAMVLRAYETQCTVCHFRHAELLDAAHILGDKHERGEATVTNGMAMCKIHHAAYDRNFLGVTPDYEVRINTALLAEKDGPMLRHGLQEMHGQRIIVPKRVADRPDRERLAERFAEFSAN